MRKFFKRFHKRQREGQALNKIIAIMQAEQHLIIEDLARQIEVKLAMMSPEKRLKTIRTLKAEVVEYKPAQP